MDWYQLLNNLTGALVTLGGVGVYKYFTHSGRKEIKADADSKVQEAQKLMIDNYEERIKDLHAIIDDYNDKERKHAVRIEEKDKVIDDKTARIRELSGKVWTSEQEVNHINAKLNEAQQRITGLTEERDKYRNWHCRKAECTDRIPPNPNLLGQKFSEYTPSPNPPIPN